MTEKPMPEEIYLLLGEGEDGGAIWCDHVPDDDMDTVKYLRADRVTEVLKQARRKLHIIDDRIGVAMIIRDIDKLLEETK